MLTVISYQGISFLLSGILAFIILLIFLRMLSPSQASVEVQVEKKDDIILDWKDIVPLKIVEIIDRTYDIKTFRFKRLDGHAFPHFLSGQFLSFAIGKPEDKVMRSYSITSSNVNCSTLDISVKLLKDGVGSGWFHKRSVGDQVYAYPPSGLFSTDKLDKDKATVVLVAGGIGITPIISIISSAIDRSKDFKLKLFYGVRSAEDLAFHMKFEELSKSHECFSYFPVLSMEDKSWKGDTGFVNIDYIMNKCGGSLQDSNFFICGPPIMREKLVEELDKVNFDHKKIFFEKFASPKTDDNVLDVDAKIEVDGSTLNYTGKQTILEFLEDQNKDVDFSCRVGVCGTCKCKLEAGEVDSLTDSGLTEEEKGKGLILPCVSRPKEDIKITLI